MNMSSTGGAYPNVSPEELAEVRRYAMEIAWSSEDDVFVVSFPDAPGVMTHSSTREEAASMGEDAIITWLTALHDAGRPVPPPMVDARRTTASSPPAYDATHIRQIRRHLNVSQQVFADYLTVSRGTVRSWEQGLRRPDGAALRLLSIAEKHPDILVAETTPRTLTRRFTA